MGVARSISSGKALGAAVLIVAQVAFAASASRAADGPKLPPAEYKPLPVGTNVIYDNRTDTVTKSDGLITVVKRRVGDKAVTFVSLHALFGEYGTNLFTNTMLGDGTEYDLSTGSEKKLEALWPLTVGKEAVYQLLEDPGTRSKSGGGTPQVWKIKISVSATEAVEIGGRRFRTYVIEERAESDRGMSFSGRKWYDPSSGLIVKSMRIGTGVQAAGDLTWSPKFAHLDKDQVETFALRTVEFPPGTSPDLVAAARGTAVAAPDKAMLAEVERLKREAEETRKADEARRAREAEEEKPRAAEIARLRQEAEEARRAADARKAREAQEDKAREVEIARLRKEVEERRKADTKLTERESKQVAAREAEITRLRKEAEERQRTEVERQAREREQAKAREVEIARRFTEAEEARKAREIEIAKLKQEAEKAEMARAAEIARLKEALAKRPEAVAAATPGAAAAFSGVDFGRYHALVIGIDNYKELPKLKTAISDARAVAEVLERDYGFKVTLLIDPDRLKIVDTLDTYREQLGPKDNLLIYYAGHGWLDQEADRGYWLPVDAKPKRRSGWVSNATVSDTLKTLTAKHVMVVADSCYSGTLVRSADVGTRTRTGDYWKRMAEKWARVAITSGGLEPVADAGGGGHSPFAKAFIDALGDNTSVVDGTTLFSQMRRPVMVAAQQTPQYADVREAGHDGGDFLFVRKK